MFDSGALEALEQAVDTVCSASLALADGAELRSLLRRLQSGIDRLEGVKAAGLDQLEETGAFADDGACSAVAWARGELRLNDGDVRRLKAAGRSMRALPSLAAAVHAGEVRVAHAERFTSGITRLGLEAVAEVCDDVLLPLARQAAPADVTAVIDRLEQVRYPEKLDEAFRRGADRRHLSLSRCGDGYHVSGFLDILTGTELKAWFTAASAPMGDHDDRTTAQRRVDALRALVTGTAEPSRATGGDPVAGVAVADTAVAAEDGAAAADGAVADSSWNGRRGVAVPRLLVIADASWLADPRSGADPPTLVGFGPIGRDLYGHLVCAGETTPILTDGHTRGTLPQAAVLNVGRTRRFATGKQRDAILARQGGVCATPGCRHSVLEFHHVNFWNRDHGRTDLDELVGICGGCHSRVHTDRLVVAQDGHGGFTFHRRLAGTVGPPLRDPVRAAA